MLDKKRIEDIGGLGIANTNILIWSEGDYDEYQVYFADLGRDNPENILKDLEVTGMKPIAFLYVQGEVKVPITKQVVTRWTTETNG